MTKLNFIYNSIDHIRNENGKTIAGPFGGANRAIAVEPTTDSEIFNVTIYNLDGNHPLWKNNIQMETKPMNIIEINNSYIKLRGVGNSFSDFGLTINIIQKSINYIILHIFDREIEIIYFKENSNLEFFQKKVERDAISTNISEIFELSKLIENCESLEDLKLLYSQIGDYNHPQISYDFGLSFYIKKDLEYSIKSLLKGASFGLKYPCEIYDDSLVDSIGQCLALLVSNFKINISLNLDKVACLAYLYLSQCIKIYENDAHDSYRRRAFLFTGNQSRSIMQIILNTNLKNQIPLPVFPLSDFYYCSSIVNSPHDFLIENAKHIYERLINLNIIFDNKEVSQFSLKEIAVFGKLYHKSLFESIENKFINGELNMNLNELELMFNNTTFL